MNVLNMYVARKDGCTEMHRIEDNPRGKVKRNIRVLCPRPRACRCICIRGYNSFPVAVTTHWQKKCSRLTNATGLDLLDGRSDASDAILYPFQATGTILGQTSL